MIVDASTPQPQPLPTMGAGSRPMMSNEIVDHLKNVLAVQPQPVQDAVDHIPHVLGLNPSAPPAGAQLSAMAEPSSMLMSTPVPAPSPIVADGSPTDAQPIPTPIAASASPVTNDPASGMPLTPPAPKAAGASTAAPIANPHMQNLERMTAEGPGVNKIHNPFLKGLATVGDAIGSGLFPEFTRFIPGFSAHHQQLLGEEENQLEQEHAQQKATSEAVESTAKAAHDTATAKYENQQADTLAEEGKRAPKADLIAVGDGLYDAKASKWIREPSDKDKEKLIAVDPDYGKSHHLVPAADGKYYIPPGSVGDLIKTPPENVHVLPDGKVISISRDPNTGKSSSEIVYEGDPKVETEVAKLDVGGKSHTVLVNKKTGETIKDLGETGEKPPVVHVDTQGHQEVMKGKELLDKAEKDYRGAAQGAKTLTDFVNSAKAGNKVTAQNLPLEGALEITTTAGTKRINRTEVEQYQGAGSLYDNIVGKLSKWTKGQPIPDGVMEDSIKLAKILQSNAYKTYRDAHASAVKRYGLKEEEPLPDPNGPPKGDRQTHGGEVYVFDGTQYVKDKANGK